MIKLYICKNKVMEITFEIDFQGKQIIYNKIQRVNYTFQYKFVMSFDYHDNFFKRE